MNLQQVVSVSTEFDRVYNYVAKWSKTVDAKLFFTRERTRITGLKNQLATREKRLHERQEYLDKLRAALEAAIHDYKVEIAKRENYIDEQSD